MKRGMRALIAGTSVGTCLVLTATAALAKDRQNLDGKAATPGHVVVDSSGKADVAWSHSGGTHADYAEFCRIPKGGKCKNPMKLPGPDGNAVTHSVSGAFPVLGSGGDLFVVAPRYVDDDIVLWQSTNGGKTFSSPTKFAGGYSNKTDPSDVVYDVVAMLVGANNPGLGFSYFGIGTGEYTFAAVTGTVQGSSLTLDSASGTPYESYWTQGAKYAVKYFVSPGTVPPSDAAWTGPVSVSKGYGGALTYGTNGTFIATQDYTGGKYPKAVRVRELNDASVGSATTLAKDKKIDLFATGDISEAPNGHVAVAWPRVKKSGKLVLRLFQSKNGNQFGKARPIAHLGNAFQIGDNLQLAYESSGNGYATFLNGSGLHLADLKRLK